MKQFSLLVVFILLNISVFAQKPGKPSISKTWTTLTDNSKVKGFLLETKENSIIIGDGYNLQLGHSYKFDQIKLIKLRKKKTFPTVFLTSIVGGAVLGGTLGYLDGDDESHGFFSLNAEEKAVFGAIDGAFIGALIGGIVGSLKVQIPINGNKNKFDIERNRLIKYSYNK